VCDGSDVCSLRDALTLANSQGSGDISFAASITGTPSTITLASALPAITSNVTITGPGANLLTVSGGGVYEVFNINSGVTANLSGLTITSGHDFSGGGIHNSGILTVSNSIVVGNTAYGLGSGGGGIYNDGTLTVSNSQFFSNTAYYGSGIYNNGGTLTVSNSTFSGNPASSNGGGIYNYAGTLTVTNSTFSVNTGYNGGGVWNYGTLTVTNSTLSGNTGYNGGGIYNISGTVTLSNSIVAGNKESGSGNAGNDCYQCGPQSGNNLVSTPGNIQNPLLGPLAYNGANQTVQTLLPLPGSPAIQAGLASTFTTDQRGLPRPTGSGVVSDLGAVQTNYTAVQFVQQPTNTLINATVTPAATLSVIESGAAAVNIPVPITFAGTGTLSGTLTETTLVATPGAAAIATYGNLSVNAAGTGDTLSVSLPITPAGAATPLTLTASSSSFDITLQATTITWSSAPPASVVYGTGPIMLAATASSGATVLYQVISGPASISGSTLSFTGAGTVVIEAYTTASGNYGSGSLTANIIVTQAPQTITFPAIAAKVFGSAPFAVSATATSSLPVTIAVQSGPATISGDTVTLTGTGTVVLVATQAGNANYSAATPVKQSFVVTPAATTTTLKASAAAITAGASETLTATVTSSGGTPTGTVTFWNGTTSLGTGTLNASGVAALLTTSLPVGTDSITASYAAQGNFAASISAATTVTVTAASSGPSPSVTFNSKLTTLNAPQGSTISDAVTITSTNGYTGTLTLSCPTLPANATCVFLPSATVDIPANGTVTVTLDIETASTTTAAVRPFAPLNTQPNPMPMLAGAFWLPGLLAAGAGLRKRCDKRVTSQVRHMLVLLVLLAGVGLMTACGGSAAPTGTTTTQPGSGAMTPKGTYTVPVTIAGTNGLPTQTLNLTLTVQ
jgi:hypothetical protein